MDCKRALQETDGNLDKAVDLLRKRVWPRLTRRLAARPIRAWSSHTSTPAGALAALVELNCETDFVARTPDFRARSRYRHASRRHQTAVSLSG